MERPPTRNPFLQQTPPLATLTTHDSHALSPQGSVTASQVPQPAALSAVDSALEPTTATPPPRRSSVVEGELGAVLWSNSLEHLPESQVARPHTSNPRYTRDTSTPRRAQLEPPKQSTPTVPTVPLVAPPPEPTPTPGATEVASDGGNSSSQLGGAPALSHRSVDRHADPQNPGITHKNSGVLWASESAHIDVDDVHRPITSNPWLARIIESDPVADASPTVASARSATSNTTEILWASGAVEDWRLLARPHASNPVYEEAIQVELDAQAAAAVTLAKSTEQQSQAWVARGTEVLWSRDETVDELQNIICRQRQHILQLENEVVRLRQQLGGQNHHSSASTLVPRSPALMAKPTVGKQEPNTSYSTVAPVVPLVRTQAASAIATSTSRLDYRNFSPSAVTVDRSKLSSAVDGEDVDIGILPDDSGEAMDACFDSHHHPAGPRSPFVTRHLQAVTQARPGTATSRPAPATGGSSSPQRLSAPTSSIGNSRPRSAPPRPQQLGGPVTFDPPNPTHFLSAATHTVPQLQSMELIDEENMHKEYLRLLRSEETFVLKSDFRDLYLRRANDFGVVVAERQLQRILGQYNSAGPLYLTYNEFAILFLKVAAW